MDVGNAPEYPSGQMLVRVGRIVGLLYFYLLAACLLRSGILRPGGVTTANGGEREGCSSQAPEDCVMESRVSFHGCSFTFTPCRQHQPSGRMMQGGSQLEGHM